MNDISLKLDERTEQGKKAARLRAEGVLPSVVYGGKTAPVLTESALIDTAKVVQAAGKHTPVHLTVNGKKRLAVIKSIDKDPIKGKLRHVAFHAVKQSDTITTTVSITLTNVGESEAEKLGLVVLQALDTIDIKAKPADLPEALTVSVLSLNTKDDKITVNDIELPKGVEFADVEQDMDAVVANVYEPGALQAANEAAGGDAESESDVLAENGGDTPQDTQAEETKPGGKLQDEPKQSNVDANK